MSFRFFLVILALLLLGASALTGVAPATAPALADSSTGLPAYLNLPTAATFLAPVVPPAAVLGLPNSTLPTTATLCSAFDFTGPVRCSVLPTGRCSMNCDQNGICSALIEAGQGQALCSTHDGNLQRRCSILPPSANQGAIPMCTTLTVGSQFGNSACSVFVRTGACSVENVPGTGFEGYCSTSGVGMQCSVFNNNSAVRGFCSVAKAGRKTCSVDDPGSNCSIKLPARGVCTIFKNALAGSCSAQPAGGAGCSVIGGPGPNPGGVCRVP